MYLVVVGVNYKTAPIELRERLTMDEGQLGAALTELKLHSHGGEFCIISTCNRTELYCVTKSRVDDEMLISFLAGYGGIKRDELKACVYIKHGHYAVKHLYRVACGLDSMALGETQVLGQIKNAYCAAGDNGTGGAVLNSLFQKAIEAGKRARTETQISCGAFSIGAAAVQLAKFVFNNLNGRKALLVGAGEMGKLAAIHLKSNGVSKVYIAGKTRNRADVLAHKLDGEPIDFDRLEEALGKVDFVITSTSSPVPIITREMMQRVMSGRCCSPIFLIDIAVPRDISPDVAEIDGVFVYNIDDLKFLIDRCRAEREAEVAKVEAIVEEETANFMSYLRTLEAVPLIKQLRAKFESVYDSEWRKYSSRLSHLPKEDQDFVRKMLKSTVTKLTHDPILRIKDYALNNEDKSKLDVARELFGLPSPPDEPNGGGHGPHGN